MSNRKSTNNTSNTKDFDDDQPHSDSDETIEEKPTGLIIKSEKKKQIQTNFGRPRKHPYKPGKYKCMYCETMCSKPSVLTKHLRAHTNERPFPCSLCKRSFKTKSNLSKHEKSKSHSSKLEEKNGISPSKREMMLQALSKLESSITVKKFESMNNLEFDSVDRKTSAVESNCSSPSSSDQNSNTSSEHFISDIVKKEKSIEMPEMNDEVPEKVENSSSCSGVLTINSQGGPITVEVQINLETMRHLQQGLSNMTNKINSPLLPITNPTQRNDAELRAAESILHMANQRPQIQESCPLIDDYRKNGTTVRKVPGTLSPLHNKSPEITNIFKSSNATKFSSKDNNSSKSTPLDESDPMNLKIHTKCLVKENLLKKMKRKQVQEINSLPDSTENLAFNNNIISNAKMNSEKTLESVLSPSITRPTNFQQTLKNETVSKHLITDSKSTSPFSQKSNRPRSEIHNKAGILNTNSQILNSLSTLSNSQTIVVITSPNIFPKNLASSPKSVPDVTLISIPEPKKSSLEFDTATLSKVITNTQSLHQHQGNKNSNVDNLSVTNSITTSRVAISPSCINSRSIPSDNTQQDQYGKEGSPNHSKQSDKPKCTSRQNSVQTTQESETESSPRLCIVEETANSDTVNLDKKPVESDEEIDVVNTDSDDDRLPLQRIPEVNYSSGSVSKRRKLASVNESESSQIDGHRLKETEKCVHLHAPNINAKDLMQDCPLNLSANRQPTIPPVSQIPDISVLQNIYQSISPSTVNNAPNIGEVNSPINALTNHNPAHPQSFQNFTPSSSLATNGHHHRDYPIFEDKIPCEVCGQSLDPSMLNLHKNLHIYTNPHVNNHNNNSNTSTSSNTNSSTSNNNNNNNTKSSTISSGSSACLSSSKVPFNKPRTYKCVVCNTAFRVIGHLRKHHKSKSHLQGLVNSGLLSKALFTKIEQSKVPIQEVIDQKTGNIIPDVLSRYISNWSHPNTDSEQPHH